MQRRNFLKLTSALAASGLASPLFAKEAFTIYGAPAMPSLIIGVTCMQGQIGKKYDAKLELWRDPDQLRAGVANGEYKVMMSPSNVGVNLANQGRKIGMVNILTEGLNFMMSKGEKITEFAQLKGKKIVMPFKNDMLDIIVRAIAKKQGISGLNIDYTASPAESAQLFLAKDYDVAITVEPLASAMILKGKVSGVAVQRGANLSDMWAQAFSVKPIIPQAGIIADTDFYAAKKADFEILNADLADALAWIKANKQSAAAIGTNFFPAPPPAIFMSIDTSNLCVKKPSEIKDELLKFYEILMEFNPKLIGGAMPKDEFFLC